MNEDNDYDLNLDVTFDPDDPDGETIEINFVTRNTGAESFKFRPDEVVSLAQSLIRALGEAVDHKAL